MQVSTSKLQILTAAAILVLISGGLAAYAQSNNGLTTGASAAPNALAGSDTNSTSTTNSTTTVTSTVTSTTTVTSSTSTTSTANATLCVPPNTGHVGRIVLPIGPSTSVTTGSITFSNNDACRASITTIGGIFSVSVLVRYAKPVTQYNVVLVANGTSYPLGNMVTGPGGNAQLSNQVLLKPGTYVVYLQIFDTSSNPGQSILVLQSASGTIVSQPFPTPAAAPASGHGNGDK